MIDDAVVVSIQNNLARVKISASAQCSSCSAKIFCLGEKSAVGMLTVLNPLQASPGDSVRIEIPEAKYNKETIRLFGVLLMAALFGLALGYLAAVLFRAPRDPSSLLGLLFGLALASFSLLRHSRGQKKLGLYPVIIDIAKKGEIHG